MVSLGDNKVQDLFASAGRIYRGQPTNSLPNTTHFRSQQGNCRMHRVRLAGLALLLLILFETVSTAQTSRGTVTGVVTDPSSASVPNATVEITNKDTNVTRS